MYRGVLNWNRGGSGGCIIYPIFRIGDLSFYSNTSLLYSFYCTNGKL